MSFCVYCNQTVSEDAHFCQFCGSELQTQQPTAESVAAQQKQRRRNAIKFFVLDQCAYILFLIGSGNIFYAILIREAGDVAVSFMLNGIASFVIAAGFHIVTSFIPGRDQ